LEEGVHVQGEARWEEEGLSFLEGASCLEEGLVVVLSFLEEAQEVEVLSLVASCLGAAFRVAFCQEAASSLEEDRDPSLDS
jgi:hypothetical protein